MPRQKKHAEQSAPVSSLPEKFEVFEESIMKSDDAKGSALKEHLAQASSPAAKPIGGMVETKWSGVQMWKCPRCNGTTFKALEAKVHTCKVAKFADEATDE